MHNDSKVFKWNLQNFRQTKIGTTLIAFFVKLETNQNLNAPDWNAIFH